MRGCLLLFSSQSFVFSLSKEAKIKINTVFLVVYRHKTWSTSLEQEQIEGAGWWGEHFEFRGWSKERFRCVRERVFPKFCFSANIIRMSKSRSLKICRLHRHVSFLGSEFLLGQEIVNRMLYSEGKEWGWVVFNRSVEIERNWKENG